MTEADPTTAPTELTPSKRLAATGLAYLALATASPGIVSPGGSPWLAMAGLVLWGVSASRPGRRAFPVEWLTGSIGMGIIVGWILYVPGPGWPYAAIGKGAYCALAGVVLRRLALRVPLAWAVPLAWIGVETLRSLVPPPIGWGWLRLGHYPHQELWLAGSARVFGVQGLGFCLALVCGGLAQLWRERRPSVSVLVAVLGGFALPAALAALVRPPEEVDGPRLLLVQPGIPQVVKQSAGTREQLFGRGVRATLAGLEREREPPDLVCWGESMLPTPLPALDLRDALRRGVTDGPWIGRPWDESVVDDLLAREDAWVRGVMLGRGRGAPGRAVLPEGTSFLSGADEYGVDDGRVVRRGGGFLWGPDGVRQPTAGKVHVVPGAESIFGLEAFEWVQEICVGIMGYVPDLVPFDEPGSVTLTARDGAEYRIGISICYDNSFIDPYVDVVRSDGVDFHLVLSNEAWYESGYELDQMMAFSTLAAITTGRSVVRTTNSGITALFGPDGSERERLVVDGRDREVEGSLAVTVPVRAERADPRAAPPFVRLRPAWLALWLVLPALVLVRRRPRGDALEPSEPTRS